ncbi:MAG TPA: FGGY family carbohydrate kinase [Bacillota bacterium]|mgnify:CR=1 FL=1|jgi:xylulokinase|nr:FGGY family carbohydrate kinase [Bacillota bacterium]HOL09388.1 FGGY family carbohydrate kinase [Bacillota bacterium]HPO97112.1 FGGY family carbohydrate kinase [Bacillota bacterium]
MSYLIGYDVGSSSVKATLLEAESGRVVAAATSPTTEMEINAPRPGWAEQDPALWWEHVKNATMILHATAGSSMKEVKAIGISYQMHGLVMVDRDYQVLRPAIIWCDSRAVAIGEQAFNAIGKTVCLERLLNSPGNFTASKLRWVKENEPDLYQKIYKVMLPGEYIGMMMTGEIVTTSSGLSEGIWWDFKAENVADLLLNYYDISPELLPEIASVFSVQGELTAKAAAELNLAPGIKISYRAGDQPNNAFSLNVLQPGEIAATAGTSGVVYGVNDQSNYDPLSRVNTFVHVNHNKNNPRYGILLCVNGTAILNRWLRTNLLNNELSYQEMNDLAASVPVGAEGLSILPYGNGAERTLENRDVGALVHGLQFNIHNRAHILRAAQEGIVFALNYGIQVMQTMGINVSAVKAGYANMFLSPLFAEAFATITGAQVELYNTDGSQGAARGAGIGAGIYQNQTDAFVGLKTIKVIEPNQKEAALYQESYQRWLEVLNSKITTK